MDVEGWLEVLVTAKKEEGDNTEETWIPFWFALLTKESDGLVDSRSLQYSSSPGDEPDHAIPLPASRSLEPCVLDNEGRFDSDLTILQLEARDCTFHLTVPPPRHAPSVGEHVYVFAAKDSATAAAWICALCDESNASPFRRSRPAEEEICFLSAAHTWMTEVFSEHAPHKVQVCASLMAAPFLLQCSHCVCASLSIAQGEGVAVTPPLLGRMLMQCWKSGWGRSLSCWKLWLPNMSVGSHEVCKVWPQWRTTSYIKGGRRRWRHKSWL